MPTKREEQLKKIIVYFLIFIAISGCSTPQPSLEVKNICSHIDTYLEKSKKDYRAANVVDVSYTAIAESIVFAGKKLSSSDFRDMKNKIRKFSKFYKVIKVTLPNGSSNLEVAEALTMQPELVEIQNEFCSTR